MVDPDGIVVVGHTRLLAAQQLGMKTVPVHVAADLSPAQARAYRIADNRTNEETCWNADLLSVEISKLVSLDYEIDVLGFDGDELAELLAQPTVGLVDPDERARGARRTAHQPGDKWRLGDHVLLCGDSHQAERCRAADGRRARHADGDRPALPGRLRRRQPSADLGQRRQAARGGARCRHEALGQLRRPRHGRASSTRTSSRVAVEQALTKTPMVYMFFGMMRAPLVFEAWEQGRPAAAPGAGLEQEPHRALAVRLLLELRADRLRLDPGCAAAGRHDGHRPTPPRSGRSPRRSSTDRRNIPPVKPVELIRRPIEYHTKAGEVIYEPFCGSGTAIIAAEMTGRALSRPRDLPGLLRRRRTALGGIHRQKGEL